MPDHRARTSPEVVVWAPGRVNLIGDHTDYTGGLAVPMAIDLGTTITGRRVEGRITLRSSGFPGTVDTPLGRGSKALADPGSVEPSWGRYVAAVASQLRTGVGFDGEVRTTIPIGTGLSSSAAFAVALVIATATIAGLHLDPVETALAAQQVEQLASGVPCGVMDQLVSLTGVSGHALLIDFRTLATEPVPVPADAAIAVIHSGEERRLASSAYAERRAQLEAAERIVGPLREATRDDLATIDDDVVRARARHVVSENDRVLRFAAALRQGDLMAAGALMIDAHASFRDDFGASTPAVDALVDRLVATPGVHGARLTGGGFGGCVVALVDPGTSTEGWGRHWLVQASGGARVL
ncbi:MAG: galactokinase [Acidimicrobiales bacterium]